MSANKKSQSRSSQIIVGATLVVILVLGYVFFRSITVNYAENVAKPLEEGLSNAGAVRACSSGHNGRGVDNTTPYYGSTFTFSKDKSEAIKIAEQVAIANGYHLQHASPSNRGVS